MEERDGQSAVGYGGREGTALVNKDGRGFVRVAQRAALTCARGLAQAALSQACIPLLVACVVSVLLLPVGIGVVLAPAALSVVRRLADRQRRWAWDWSGVQIATSYRPRPRDLASGLTGRLQRGKWLLTDPATWRDLLWMLANVPMGLVLGLLPACLIVNGLGGVLVSPWIWLFSGSPSAYWPLSVPLGVLTLVIGVLAGRGLLRGHAMFTGSLLAPRRRELAEQVGRLTESRSQLVDSSAAELRRIERDLHDGAQARLVALGMSIGLAEQLVKGDPDAALALLAEARRSSGQALSDLRGLVRGIHPPVLAERGLDGAVRALALALPLPVDVHIEVGGRPPAPVESAVYFAIAEALANVVKHSAARRSWVQVHHADDRLVAIVGDDGAGGAEARVGGGLHGIGRRLAAFDGITAVTSPSGGPTVVTMELPCVLSSVRT